MDPTEQYIQRLAEAAANIDEPAVNTSIGGYVVTIHVPGKFETAVGPARYARLSLHPLIENPAVCHNN